MKRKKKRTAAAPKPLRTRLFQLLAILIISIISVSIYTAWDYKKIQTSVLKEYNQLYATQLAKSTRQTYDTYKNLCYSVAFNQGIQEYLTETDPAQKYDLYQEQQSYLSNCANLDSYITDIAIIASEGNSITLAGAVQPYQHLAETLDSLRFSFCSMGILKVDGVDCHILAMPIRELNADSPYLGVLFLAIDISHFFENGIPLNVEYSPAIIFSDVNNGRLLYGSEKVYQALAQYTVIPDSFELQVENTSYSVDHYTMSGIDSELYVLTDKTQYNSRIMQLLKRHFIWVGLVTFLIAFFLLRFTHPLITSLNCMTSFMEEITSGSRKAAKGGLIIDQGRYGCVEITNINDAFNNMLRETDELNHTIFETYTRMYEMEVNNRKTEIAFLRSQVNPHFLYNTLTSICGMASVGMTDEIITVTNALSQIFRYSIKGSDMVTVSRELEIVRSYLHIQQMRFEGRFTVRYDMSPESLDCLIPKMVIQPIVENAIVHGLEQSLKKGELLIGAGCNPEFGYLAIWIYDTGVGMSKEKLEEIREAIRVSSKPKTGDAGEHFRQMDEQVHDSIGILNVNTRMTLHFGEEYSLIIDSEENVGTNVQLRIPYRTQEDAQKSGNKEDLCIKQS